MTKVKVKIDISGLEKKLNKYVQNVCRVAAGKIRDDLNEEAITAIAKFYTSYSPKHYKRHYYNFMDNSFQKYYANPHNKIYYGGVKLTPELMDDIYQADTQQVFDTVYAGFHGPASMIGIGNSHPDIYGVEKFYNHPLGDYTINVPARMWPSPMQRLLDKKNEIIYNIQDYIDYASKKVRI